MQAGKDFDAHSFLQRVYSARWGLGDGNDMLLHRSCSRGRKWWITLGIFAVVVSVPVQILSHFLTSPSEITEEDLKPQHFCHFLFVVCLGYAWNHSERVRQPVFTVAHRRCRCYKAPFVVAFNHLNMVRSGFKCCTYVTDSGCEVCEVCFSPFLLNNSVFLGAQADIRCEN